MIVFDGSEFEIFVKKIFDSLAKLLIGFWVSVKEFDLNSASA